MNLILPSKGSQNIPFPSLMTKKILLGAFQKFLKKSVRELITMTEGPLEKHVSKTRNEERLLTKLLQARDKLSQDIIKT